MIAAGAVAADLRERVARLLEVPSDAVATDQPVDLLGLDSLHVADLRLQIRDAYGVELSMEEFVEDATLAHLATLIASGAQRTNVAPTGSAPAVPRASSHPSPNGTAAAAFTSTRTEAGSDQALDVSLFFFAMDAEAAGDLATGGRYRLLLDSVRFADQRGFTATWLPERHFHPFGGLYPDPAVLAGALATVTERIRLRAGSVVLPLNDPIRVAESWAVVDNLSGGRVDLAFATGWNPTDFVLAPDRYADRADTLLADVDVVRRLWRGETIARPDGEGSPASVRLYPAPVQPELTPWITCTGTPERFEQAGASGANVLTGLLFQSFDELAANIARYRAARERHGHAPDAGRVTLMLHTFVGDDRASVRAVVREPILRYLTSSADLWGPASGRADGVSQERRQAALEYAFERYLQRSGLFGSVEDCCAVAERARSLGVQEIACLIDFGLSPNLVMRGLERLDELRRRFPGSASQNPRAANPQTAPVTTDDAPPAVPVRPASRLERLKPPGGLVREGLQLGYRCVATDTLVTGREHLATLPDQVIFAGTHRSHPDLFALRRALRTSPARRHARHLLVVADRDNIHDAVGWWAPLFAWGMDMYLLQRHDDPHATLRGVAQAAGTDRSVFITPQGRHCTPAQEQAGDPQAAFRPGVAVLADALGAPVVPYGIAGTEDLFSPAIRSEIPPGYRGPVFAGLIWDVKRVPVAIAFGAPLRREPAETARDFAARLQVECYALSRQAEASRPTNRRVTRQTVTR